MDRRDKCRSRSSRIPILFQHLAVFAEKCSCGFVQNGLRWRGWANIICIEFSMEQGLCTSATTCRRSQVKYWKCQLILMARKLLFASSCQLLLVLCWVLKCNQLTVRTTLCSLFVLIPMFAFVATCGINTANGLSDDLSPDSRCTPPESAHQNARFILSLWVKTTTQTKKYVEIWLDHKEMMF